MESISKYRKKFEEVDINLYTEGIQLQEKLIDDLVLGFSRHTVLNRHYASYLCNGGIFKLEASGLNTIKYHMDRIPLGSETPAPNNMKRCAKVLILLWYLFLIRNQKKIFYASAIIEIIFKPLKGVIKNTTNTKNYGFSEKVFSSKITSKHLISGDYSWSIKVEDLLESESQIKEFLKKYLFEETNFCGKIMPITKKELEIIKQHC